MNWLLSLVVSLLTGVAGLFSVGLLANLNVRWYRISSFEGASGYYVVGLALLGGVVGCIVGLICARVSAGWTDPGFFKGLGFALGTMLSLVLVVGVVCRLAADVRPTIDGNSLTLEFEVRAPRGLTMPLALDDYGAHVYLDNAKYKTKGVNKLDLEEARQEDGHWILPGSVDLGSSSSRKSLRLYLNKTYDTRFFLPLRGHPRKADLEWTPWIEGSWDAGKPRPEPEEAFFIRYRVVVDEPPPPPPTREEVAAREAAEEQAAFDAIPADAPITTWLPYTRYGMREDFLKRAIANIQARENFEQELGALITGDDHDTAAAGLWMIQHLDVFPPALNDHVAAAGRKIADLIRVFNETPVDEDPGMEGAANASIRFHSWMEAVRTLRQRANGDFTPELHEILQLSRSREDSHVMRANIRRVASYYMNTWAGVAPLPGDPPPR